MAREALFASPWGRCRARVMRSAGRLLLLVAASMLLVSPLGSQVTPTSSASASGEPARRHAGIVKAVEKLVETIGHYGGTIGISVVEVQSGEVVAAHHDHDALNPASNMKLLTAAAALWHLSGTFQYRTAFYGKRNGSTVEDLALRGCGDPSLTAADLWDMVTELRRSGIRRVQGDILVDQSCFDDAYLPPGFEQQPNEWGYFRAPVSAIALNRNVITMSVYASAKDQPAAVWFDPPGYVDVAGSVKTDVAGSAQSVSVVLVPNGLRLTAKLGGSIPDKSHPIIVPKRVENPALFAGYAVRAMLAEHGIAASGGVRLGGDKARDVLVLHRSRPLSELLYELGKRSDNFYAEMLLKGLAAKDKGHGLSSADGAEVIIRYLKSMGALDDGTVIRNGSGLFDSNRVTAGTLTRVLRAAYLDPAMSAEYVAHLAIGGVDGTLHGRFASTKKHRVLRAKTGTLNDVASLSGYVLAPGGRSPLAFAIVVNNVGGKVTGARAAVDKCVSSIVRTVHRTQPETLGHADEGD